MSCQSFVSSNAEGTANFRRGLSQEETAEALGLTLREVRDAEERALRKLRRNPEARKLFALFFDADPDSNPLVS